MTGGSSGQNRPKRVGTPKYSGLATYRDHLGRFEFKYASDWTRDELTDDRDGVILLPEADEPDTYFAVWVTKLDEHVKAEDLDVLSEGFESGLQQLPALQIEKAHDETLDNLVKLERYYTFEENGETRKRRLWVLYVDTWQFVVVFQAATPEEWTYWEAMGTHVFGRFEIPPELWFATDRNLSPYRDVASA